MSSQFQPIQLPPGVVSQATKKMRSSNWSEVNFIRWRENQLIPMGGQVQITDPGGVAANYKFASRCKLIHGWYDLNNVYHIAYLCEQHLYVDTGGTLVDITPSGGMAQPTGLVGGYGDGFYNQGVQVTAAAPFTTSSTTITMSTGLAGARPGMDVFNWTTGQDVGRISSYTGITLTLTGPALSGGSAGHILNFGAYNEQRAIPASVAITQIPDAYQPR